MSDIVMMKQKIMMLHSSLIMLKSCKKQGSDEILKENLRYFDIAMFRHRVKPL